jgi:hypothetical protein
VYVCVKRVYVREHKLRQKEVVVVVVVEVEVVVEERGLKEAVHLALYGRETDSCRHYV